MLLEHHSVSDACVIGVADERSGERPCAFVVRAQDAATLDEAALQVLPRLAQGSSIDVLCACEGPHGGM